MQIGTGELSVIRFVYFPFRWNKIAKLLCTIFRFVWNVHFLFEVIIKKKVPQFVSKRCSLLIEQIAFHVSMISGFRVCTVLVGNLSNKNKNVEFD